MDAAGAPGGRITSYLPKRSGSRRRALSKRLGHPFVELDERVLAAFPEGSVREVWSVHGEAAWREAESAALVATLAADEQVVALGGGTPMIPAARQRIEADRKFGLRCKVFTS